MSGGRLSAKRPAGPISAVTRLKMDYMRLKKDPVPYIVAEPVASNLLEWHYVVTGPEQSPYHGGLYHGKLVFPSEFPFKPPSIYMITPNGRFKVNTRLCLSISDYHPDTWNPAWSVSTILTGLLSFMLENSPTLGAIDTTDQDKRQFAADSHEFNLKSKTFCELFPELASKCCEAIERQKLQLEQNALKPSEGRFGDTQKNGSVLGNNPGDNVQVALTNLLMIGGFAAFAFIVQYVLQSLASTAEH